MLMRYLLLLLCLGWVTSLTGQSLAIGGQAGGATALSADQPLRQQLGGEAGLFARYTTRQGRLGVRLGLGYAHHPATGETWRAPVLPEWSLVKERVHLYAGPYAGLGRAETEALSQGQLRLRWGFMTGLDLTIPLTRRMVLVQRTQVQREQGPWSPEAAQWVPARALSISFSLGVAWRWSRRQQ